ncbi:helix-turn-helix domain-containing protein [Oceanicella actignis]|uniref:DNA-binding transcriptional regulator, XRE-family HTH domain n=1 Tax=Oceanicella actignis TaxID=1189325 RepID=A0A1M7S8N1_9RHOB|nr:XRE family transcriptional regulator [Oceanicella actignis]TYO91640.1 XRE family transcriptional regulator [Oceanicella actignis]SET32137.1 transcriptional regulator, XRE family with cupin sensor [Oceanicella actignis]SHN54836.1 DNA-binding transcriptional regulator, XRE-family HTH domain [Oceanicella actignis]
MTDRQPSLIQIATRRAEASPLAPLRLGERVRQIRKAHGWTLEEAARRAGLARSTLSKIENEQMSPTFDAVQKLARGLGIDVPQLFAPAPGDRALARRAVTRAGAGEPHPTRTYEHFLLAPEISRKKMLPYRAVVRARSIEEFDGWVRHSGEEFLFVLSGAVRLFTEFYEPVDLGEGDSVYYDAGMGHNVVSISEEDAQILWVTSLTG